MIWVFGAVTNCWDPCSIRSTLVLCENSHGTHFIAVNIDRFLLAGVEGFIVRSRVHVHEGLIPSRPSGSKGDRYDICAIQSETRSESTR